MNLYPVYQERRETEIVKKGKFYSMLYLCGFVSTVVAWTVIVVIAQGGDGFVAKIHPANYNPSTDELVPREKIEELQKDEEKKNVKCIFVFFVVPIIMGKNINYYYNTYMFPCVYD